MAYSNDFRKEVLFAYQNNRGSMRKLAKQFNVSKDFVFDLVKLYRETGSVKARANKGGTRPTLDDDGLKKLEILMDEYDGVTIDKMCEIYQKKHLVKVSRAAMGRYLLKIKLVHIGLQGII